MRYMAPASFRTAASLIVKSIPKKKEKKILTNIEYFIQSLPELSEQTLENPEIFSALFALTCNDISAIQQTYFSETLLIHSGLLKPEKIRKLPLRPYYIRLLHTSKQILRCTQNELEDISKTIAIPFKDKFIIGFKPQLFSDLLPETIYPNTYGDSQEPKAVKTLEQILKALNLIQETSPTAASTFEAMVKTISLVRPHKQALKRKSFSCRTSYLGGIFIQSKYDEVTQLAEDLLHESIHQSMWAQWLLNENSEFVTATEKVRSPFTDRDLPLNVMLQALVIYTASYFLHIESIGRLSGRDYIACEQRIITLTKGIPLLRKNIRIHAAKKPAIYLFINELESFTGDLRT